MVESIEEFQDELKSLREDIRRKGPNADVKLVASWVDRLVMAMEKIAPSLGMISEEMDVVSEGEGCSCECCTSCAEPAPKKAMKPVKKAAKKK